MCYCQQRQLFSVYNALENVRNLGLHDLFEQKSSNGGLNLRKCESIWSELDISIIKARFEANKDSSFIFNSTGYLVEADKIITEEEV